jgi:hypothetical protein
MIPMKTWMALAIAAGFLLTAGARVWAAIYTGGSSDSYAVGGMTTDRQLLVVHGTLFLIR